jgi:hemolysin D
VKRDPEKLLEAFLPEAQALERRLPSAGSRATLYAIGALIAAAIGWATFSEIDRIVAARGRLATPLPNLLVQPLEPGVLKSLNARPGQVVKKGEVLATLDPTFTSADAAQLAVRTETLRARLWRLEHELSGKPAAPGGSARERQEAAVLAERRGAYEARLRQFDETVAKLRSALETNRFEQQALGERLKALAELEAMYRRLEEQKFGSRALMLSVAEKRLEVERDHTVARHREAEIRREIAAAEAERSAFVRDWRQKLQEDLSETRRQHDEAAQQLLKARRREELVRLEAPEDAVVLEIAKKSVGSVLKEGEPLFTLVPANAVLEAEVEVSPADVGDLRVGDPVRIKVDAYPFQKHGTLDGKLIAVGADSLSRPVPGGEAYYYVARVALLTTRLKELPESARLLPGMTVSAEVVVGRRSVISYLLYPVIRVLDESIRER